MTTASIRQDRKPTTGGYTRLERTVLQALTWELRDIVPDLAAQIAASRLTLRRNSGFGFFTEVTVNRPLTATAAGVRHLGTVHAMIGSLPEPVAFQLRVRDGRLLGLLADSYGQDTRLIDFTNTPFDQIFILDQGRSVELRQFAPPESDAAPTPRPRPAPRREPRSDAMPVMTPTPAQQRRPTATPLSEPPAPMDDMTLRMGLWTLIGVAALIALGLGVNIIAIAIAGYLAVRFVNGDRGLALARKAQDQWRTAREDPRPQAATPT